MPLSDQRIRELSEHLGCELSPFSTTADYKNEHLVGFNRATGRRFFIKVIESGRYFSNEVAAGELLRGLPVPTIPIEAHGDFDDGAHWISYAWADLQAFMPTEQNIASAGRILGKLHSATLGLHDQRLRRYGTIAQLIDEKIEAVESIDRDLAARLKRMRVALEPSVKSFEALFVPLCLLHGDMGWRNISLTEGGVCVLLDFEHAACGLPLLDFAKLWDRELLASDIRQNFIGAYVSEAPLSTETIVLAMPAVRLWAAAGVFPYARPRGDTAFEHHGLRIIERLEHEVGL